LRGMSEAILKYLLISDYVPRLMDGNVQCM